jgi:hypothetical protein
MPWSVIENVPPIANEIQRLNPKRMIDLGVGLGLYGVIARQLLDGIHGRFAPESWTAEIIGVEAFEAYRNPCWASYTDVVIRDFASAEISGFGFDLVLMGDSLEHLAPEHGEQFLEQLIARNKQVILSVPNGPCAQGAAHGNEYEVHRTTFYPNSFDRYGANVLHTGFCIVASIPGKA